ncbi:hypothetical protein F383_39465 [Gossypium arboreum]|uniref:Uncharacterized protein n=1 Tax=Gossypium arboreum TaxID=29729 RepID=A0A0B0MT05_GOSAR|nr:hypothetical protein F383_39465 [Gossypium arboreum]
MIYVSLVSGEIYRS